jgi:ketosteroid isomerase-like protein
MSEQATLLHLSQCLLDSIVTANWDAYADLCDPSLTCFEPEALGQLVEGLEFHRFYFNLDRSPGRKVNTTIANPQVRIMGDAALVCYIRLTQTLDAAGSPVTRAVEETRVWQKQDGKWKHVHFHRSPVE